MGACGRGCGNGHRALFDSRRCGQGVGPHFDRLLVLLAGLGSILTLRHRLLNQAGLVAGRGRLPALEWPGTGTAAHQRPSTNPTHRNRERNTTAARCRGLEALVAGVEHPTSNIEHSTSNAGLPALDSAASVSAFGRSGFGLQIACCHVGFRFHFTLYRWTNPVLWRTTTHSHRSAPVLRRSPGRRVQGLLHITRVSR